MGLGNLDLETLFVMLAGFLLGAVPAFLLIGFYFGRRVEKERKTLQLSYERQINALRATMRRMMERIDQLTEERNQLKRSNQALRLAVRSQHDLSDQSGQALEDAQKNMARLQERLEELQAERLRQEGRLEQAHIHEERMAAQFQQAVSQFTQTKRLQQNLLFAASQLREARVYNQALEERFGKSLRPIADKGTTPAELLGVEVIEGLEPTYAERLHESGIHTLGDLVRQTPARVAHFAGLESWDDSAAWIAEAKMRLAGSARPQA